MKPFDHRAIEALNIAAQYGMADGADHKQWVIDQMCRCLLQQDYFDWVLMVKSIGEDGTLYGWEEGIPP